MTGPKGYGYHSSATDSSVPRLREGTTPLGSFLVSSGVLWEEGPYTANLGSGSPFLLELMEDSRALWAKELARGWSGEPCCGLGHGCPPRPHRCPGRCASTPRGRQWPAVLGPIPEAAQPWSQSLLCGVLEDTGTALIAGPTWPSTETPRSRRSGVTIPAHT